MGGLQPVGLGSIAHPVADELLEGRIVQMLQFAAATCAEMAAGRHCMMRPVGERTIDLHQITRRCAGNMAAAGGNAIAARSDADDLFGCAHSKAP